MDLKFSIINIPKNEYKVIYQLNPHLLSCQPNINVDFTD